MLDGEAIALDETGRPRPFQETASRTAMGSGVEVTPYFFDLLHLDGVDLLDEPGHVRAAALDAAGARGLPRPAPGDRRRPTPPRPSSTQALAAGHEGVVVKNLAAPYDAGRRGSAWVKVKPVHTLDLVVLAVEWGSGRREGWLSNIHLGARDPDAGGFVMLGKTFKGMTDEMLDLADRAVHRAGRLRRHDPRRLRRRASAPSRSSRSPSTASSARRRYPGGMALRFARVVRYRDDKTADEADTIDMVRELFGRD